MNLLASDAGRLVENISLDAVARSSKFLSTDSGLSCCTIAFMTHFWRAIRE